MSEVTGPLVAWHQLGFAYGPGQPPVIQRLSGELRRGEIVSVIGPSGCGKSTLVAMTAGLLQPTVGEVAWDSTVVDTDTRHRSTMMFQKDTLLPWLTAEENVLYSLKFLRLEPQEKQDRVARLLSIAGMYESRALYPYQLSGGMRRRVALLVGVAPMPHVLLLDEPFSALDEPTRVEIHTQVVEIVRRFAITVLLVTHDLAEAVSMSDRVVMLSRRPATVVDVEVVPFGEDRDVRAVREETAFHEIYRRLWHRLNAEIQPPIAEPL